MEKTIYAFPTSGLYKESGMTLRDYFAAQVLRAEISRGGLSNPVNVSAYAYQVADLMMKIREG